MKSYLFTAVWGIIVWLLATLFFRFFGEKILFSPRSNEFFFSIIILLIVTAALLIGVIYLYLIFDKSNNAALKFGIIGTIIGLMLDTFSLSNHYLVFPALDDAQIIAFTTWMSFAYALYLLIPFLFSKKRIIKEKEFHSTFSN